MRQLLFPYFKFSDKDYLIQSTYYDINKLIQNFNPISSNIYIRSGIRIAKQKK